MNADPVTPEEKLKQRCRRLLTLGVAQKVLAAKLGIVPATMSRWLNGKTKWVPDVNVPAKLDAFEQELATPYQEKETSRADAPARETFRTASGEGHQR